MSEQFCTLAMFFSVTFFIWIGDTSRWIGDTRLCRCFKIFAKHQLHQLPTAPFIIRQMWQKLHKSCHFWSGQNWNQNSCKWSWISLLFHLMVSSLLQCAVSSWIRGAKKDWKIWQVTLWDFEGAKIRTHHFWSIQGKPTNLGNVGFPLRQRICQK